ncbi:hypothetical protein BaRGS_00028904 [Batillaria attramentaria]|uniref:Uncharacterized protein n=1 Tax=Batillaria attramentaria TaxID=370345 RepID=A0ABD0JXM2_9CAEN
MHLLKSFMSAAPLILLLVTQPSVFGAVAAQLECNGHTCDPGQFCTQNKVHHEWGIYCRNCTDVMDAWCEREKLEDLSATHPTCVSTCLEILLQKDNSTWTNVTQELKDELTELNNTLFNTVDAYEKNISALTSLSRRQQDKILKQANSLSAQAEENDIQKERIAQLELERTVLIATNVTFGLLLIGIILPMIIFKKSRRPAVTNATTQSAAPRHSRTWWNRLWQNAQKCVGKARQRYGVEATGEQRDTAVLYSPAGTDDNDFAGHQESSDHCPVGAIATNGSPTSTGSAQSTHGNTVSTVAPSGPATEHCHTDEKDFMVVDLPPLPQS